MPLLKTCSRCKTEQTINDFTKDISKPDGLRNSCKNCRRTYRARNKNHIAQKSQEYHELHRQDLINYLREYRCKNRDRLNEFKRNRYRTNINYRIGHNLRARLRLALKRNTKVGSAVKDLGCSIEELRTHLEEQFKLGMTWDNYGSWHIDHIKPLCKFDLSDRDEHLSACHYLNLQPLWASENIAKGGG